MASKLDRNASGRWSTPLRSIKGFSCELELALVVTKAEFVGSDFFDKLLDEFVLRGEPFF